MHHKCCVAEPLQTIWLWQPLRAALAHAVAVVVERAKHARKTRMKRTGPRASSKRMRAPRRRCRPWVMSTPALEPVISGTIMELHHSKHHNTYVTNFNAATEKLATAVADDDVTGIVAAQAAIKFNGGGHLNHPSSGRIWRPHRKAAARRRPVHYLQLLTRTSAPLTR